jgi:hypothetical protein
MPESCRLLLRESLSMALKELQEWLSRPPAIKTQKLRTNTEATDKQLEYATLCDNREHPPQKGGQIFSSRSSTGVNLADS